jgi:hypothetical protein
MRLLRTAGTRGRTTPKQAIRAMPGAVVTKFVKFLAASNLPTLARAAKTVADKVPGAGWTALKDIRDSATAIVTGIFGTGRGVVDTARGLSTSAAMMAENLPELVRYLGIRVDILGVFFLILLLAVALGLYKVLVRFAQNGFSVSGIGFSVAKNPNFARLIEKAAAAGAAGGNTNRAMIMGMVAAQPQKAQQELLLALINTLTHTANTRGLRGVEELVNGVPGFQAVVPPMLAAGRRARPPRPGSIVNITAMPAASNTASSARRTTQRHRSRSSPRRPTARRPAR